MVARRYPVECEVGRTFKRLFSVHLPSRYALRHIFPVYPVLQCSVLPGTVETAVFLLYYLLIRM